MGLAQCVVGAVGIIESEEFDVESEAREEFLGVGGVSAAKAEDAREEPDFAAESPRKVSLLVFDECQISYRSGSGDKPQPRRTAS